MQKKSLLIFYSVLLLIIPVHAFGKADGVHIITTLTGNKDIGQLGLIGGVFFDENKKRLYVSDSSNKRILSYDAELKYLSAWQPGEALASPTGLVRTSDGTFIVVEPSIRGILKVDMQQRSIEPVDFSAVPEADTFYPGRIAIDPQDNIYIIDRAHSRVLLFNADLQFKREIVQEGKATMNDIKVDKQGNIYVLSTIEGIVTKYDSAGKKVLEFGQRGQGEDAFNFPVSLAVDQKGLIYVVDQHKSKILVFDNRGTFLFAVSKLGWWEGRLAFPSFIFINNAGMIFVVDQDNSRISIFQ